MTRAALCALLPAGLAGFLLVLLLLFLNPELPLNLRTLGGGGLAFSLLLGIASLVVHFLWPPLARAASQLRPLPWTLTAVLVAAAIGCWVNASYQAFYLPPGVYRRLLVAAAWLSLGALIAFYTALLHSLHPRPYGRRSRLLFLLLAAASIYVLFERRQAYRPPVSIPERLASAEARPRPQILLVGLPTASLDLLLPLAERGGLPFLDQALRGGARGRLAPTAPVRSTPAWTTVATGRLPYRHGLPDEEGHPVPLLGAGAPLRLLPIALARLPGERLLFGRAQPLGASELLVPAAWTTLARLGLAAAVVDWPASTPAALSDGAWVISDRFFDDPRSAGACSPADLAEVALRFRPTLEERDELPAAAGLPNASASLARALAGDRWRQGVARRLLAERRDLALLWLRLPGLATAAAESFGGFAAVEFDGSRGRAERRAAEELAAYFAEVDRLLAELWQASEAAERVLVVVAPWGGERPTRAARLWGQLSGDPQVGGRVAEASDGLLLLFGSGVRPGTELPRLRAVDLLPTLFYRLGLAVARDLDGRVLTEAFEPGFLARTPLAFVPSYDALPRRSG